MVELLEALSYAVELAPVSASARTWPSKGFLRQAKAVLDANLRALDGVVSESKPLLGIEPSGILTYRDETLNLSSPENRETARRIAPHCLIVEEFLAREIAAGRIGPERFTRAERNVHLHGHCIARQNASSARSRPKAAESDIDRQAARGRMVPMATLPRPPRKLAAPVFATVATALLLGLADARLSPAAANESEPAPPNVVYIISDDHSWTDYGFMGHPHIETPHLDALAERSAVFTRGYVPTALCRPALATLANGLYAHQHKISGNDPARLPEMQQAAAAAKAAKGAKGKAKGGERPPEPEAYLALREQLISKIDQHPTVATLLGAEGYLSHQSGKWWEGGFDRGGFTHGMTRGFPKPGGRHGDDGLAIGREGMEPVLDFIDYAVDRERPFFVWYAPFLPHTPHNPPERLFQKYKDKGIESDFVARYYAMVEWFDETCGELLDHLEKRGLAENTLVLYVGDNGWIQQEDAGGFAPRSKQSANEGGTRQPTLISWPGTIQPGDRGQQLCSTVDFLPTVLSAVGVEIPEHLPGLDLLPVLKSGEPTPRTEVFGETFAHDIADIEDPEASLLYRWVVEERWKLLLTYDGAIGRYADIHPRTDARPQLYDLLADPHENENLAGAHPEEVQRLAAKLQEWWPVNQRRTFTEWSEEPLGFE